MSVSQQYSITSNQNTHRPKEKKQQVQVGRNGITKWAFPVELPWLVVFPIDEDFPWWSWHRGQQADNNMACKHKYPEIIDPWGTSYCLHEDPTTTLQHHIYHLPNKGTAKCDHLKMSFLLFFLSYSSTRQSVWIYGSFWDVRLTAFILVRNMNIVSVLNPPHDRKLDQPISLFDTLGCMTHCSDFGAVYIDFPLEPLQLMIIHTILHCTHPQRC